MTNELHLWIPLTLASALLLACYDVARKHGVNRNAVLPVLFLATLCGTCFFTIMLLATGQLKIAWDLNRADHIRVAIKAVIVGTSWICVFYAMRALPISIVAPIRGSAPFWTLCGAMLLYHEIPSIGQAAGMGVVLVGYVLFSRAGRMEGIYFARHSGIALLAAGTLLGAIAALYDKYLLQQCHIPPNTVQFWFSVWLIVVLGGALAAQRGAGLARTPFAWRATIPVVGVALILSDWCYFHALAEPGVPISIVSLIRRSNAALSFTVGAIVFKEGNLKSKILALIAILVGVAMLCLTK